MSRPLRSLAADWLTTSQAARALRIHPDTLVRRINDGAYPGPPRTEGQNRYFDHAWLKEAKKVDRKR